MGGMSLDGPYIFLEFPIDLRMKVAIIKSVVLMHEVMSENHRLNIYAYALKQVCNERLFNSSYLLSN